MLAKKFEMKYGGKARKHRKDRLQDLIDIGFGYDETDPFIDNSEAYDELVPASLTTKYGGFYINTGTLQFRQASDTEEDDITDNQKHKPPKAPRIKEDDIEVKKRKRKEEGEKEKKPRKKVPKQLGVVALNSHKSEKKKKRYKDSLSLAAMIRKFQKEKDALKKESNPKVPVTLPTSSLTKSSCAASAMGDDIPDFSLNSADPDLPIFVSTNEHELFEEAENALEMLDDFDFDRLLDAASDGSPLSESGGENGNTTQPTFTSQVMPKVVPTLPDGLPVLLEKRIEDLRVVSAAKLFDEEGRKKFFTQEMNNILLDIELQLQEVGPVIRSGVYAHLEAFVPCNKETLVKRLKKLHLNVQDDRLREPLQKLKLAVSSVMPEQLFKYQEDCQARSQAKCAKLQADEEREKNGSEDDDDEKPGKRVIGPRKKFHWDDTIRTLLCNLVEIKLGCYELEPNKSQSAEDYLKSFMETEVKPLWPKGWMQARMLFKESRSVHNHLTSAPAKKKVIPASKPKVKECSPKKDPKAPVSLASVGGPSISSNTSTIASASASSAPAQETICLDDSLDEDLSFHSSSLDLVSEALAVINNGNKGPSVGSRLTVPTTKPRPGLREEKLASIMSKLPLATPKKLDSTQTAHSSSLIAGHTGPVPKKPQDLAHTGISSGLIAGSSIQNPKVSLEPLPARLLQQGLQRSSQIHASSSSQTHVSSSQAQVAASSHALGTSEAQDASPLTQATKVHQHSAVHQNYVSPLQATISKSQTNPVVKLSNNPQLSCSSQLLKTSDKPLMYRLPLSTPSPGNGSQGPHPLVSRTASSTTTSSNYLAKAMVSQISTQGFKPPLSMTASPKLAASPKPATSPKPLPSPKPSASPKPSLSAKPSISTKLISKSNPTPKPAVCPTSSSPNTLVAQSSHSTSNNPVHKQPSGVNISRQSPTLNLLPSNRTPGLPSTKTLPAPSKLTNSSPTGTAAGKSSLSGIPMNVPASRGSNLNSSGANRTSLSGGAGGGTQGATKPLSTPHRPASASGSSMVAASVQSTAGASLLANASPLTLMTSPLSVTNQTVTPFGMLGGLVPVTMPFQFPLELLGFGTDTAGVTTTSGSTSAAFHHSLTQNLLKSLQPGTQHAATLSHSPLPAHVQQAFNDGGQSKGDTKLPRKSQ
ncbi:ubinuclein-2 isoform X2 [Phodopus roborovskii]|uniref:ubinuclein-2 isoform X2 n=1 Tax=Phodopus roborovskii TaxID=109678 RepID=UPI0021E4F9F0|nr:ubinuclein-2 isoform X2 [Phodopus roborovskii]